MLKQYLEQITIAEILKKTDCSIVQGYYYDRPLPVEIFEERLRNPVYG